MNEVILGLGSNMGDRETHLNRAIEQLSPFIHTITRSPIYETSALLPEGADPSWDAPFLNMAIKGTTTLDPQALLTEIKTLEQTLGRTPRDRWAPREIDIDILAMNDTILHTPNLTIPHKELLNRDFALRPLTDIAPNWVHPIQNKTARELSTSLLPSPGTSNTLPPRGEGNEARFAKQTVAAVDEGQITTSESSSCPPPNLPPEGEEQIPTLVGILNVTPDSFSDGGNFLNVTAATKHAQSLINAGATTLDIGAESTRPGAGVLTHKDEWQRLEPILTTVIPLAHNANCTVSLDTRHPETAKKALDLGIDWLNDVTGFTSPEMIKIAATSNATIVVMHSLSIPADPTHTLPENTDTIKVLTKWGKERIQTLTAAHIDPSRIILDPGIGFGKTAEQSLEILRNIRTLKKAWNTQVTSHQSPVTILIGHSRKSFLKLFTDKPASERDPETHAISLYLATQGVEYLRVHDIEGTTRMLQPFTALHA